MAVAGYGVLWLTTGCMGVADYIHKEEFTVFAPRELVIAAIAPALSSAGLEFIGATAEAAGWRWEAERPGLYVTVRESESAVQVLLVQNPFGRVPASKQFVRVHELLAESLTSACGQTNVKRPRKWWSWISSLPNNRLNPPLGPSRRLHKAASAAPVSRAG